MCEIDHIVQQIGEIDHIVENLLRRDSGDLTTDKRDSGDRTTDSTDREDIFDIFDIFTFCHGYMVFLGLVGKRWLWTWDAARIERVGPRLGDRTMLGGTHSLLP
eukprot:1394655-Amorphochlora_amoeboformis.AAC.1